MASWKKFENKRKEESTTGPSSSGKVSLSILNGEVGSKNKYEVKSDESEKVQASVSGGISGSLVEGEVSSSYGAASSETEVKLASGSLDGEAKASFEKDGEFSPELSASVKAEVTGASIENKTRFGNEKNNVHTNVEGKLGDASAEASIGVGKVTYKDKNTGEDVTAWGAQGKIGAEAYVAKGSISGGFNVFGLKVDITAEGKAGGAGIAAEGHVTTGGIGGGISLGAAVGVGLGVSVDWSQVKIPTADDILNFFNLNNNNETGNKKSEQYNNNYNIKTDTEKIGKAVFDVKPKRILSNAEELNKTIKKLEQQLSKLESIKNQLEIKGISAIGIKKILGNIVDDIKENQTKINVLSESLKNIAELYKNTEHSIISDI